MRFKTTLRTLIAATAVFAACATAYAEMTDEQVIQYVQQQKKNGKTERQIGKELISKASRPHSLNACATHTPDPEPRKQNPALQTSR